MKNRGIVITGTHSGCGKTTVTLGLLAALKKKGLEVQSFKVGPDFIDSGLHKLITGRFSRNLDIWMCGGDYVRECFYKYSMDMDISVIEGVMGMYDGEHSTADLAKLLNLPVILVVDAYGMAESAGVLIKGFRDLGLENGVNIEGIIFNRVASDRHYERLKKSVKDVAVLGYIPRDLNFEIPHRHLGLMVAEENPISQENLERLGDVVLHHIDIDLLVRSSESSDWSNNESEILNSKLKTQNSKLLKIAIAYDKAFCFYYEDNLDLLRDAGAEIVTFSPLSDTRIPENVDAIYIGGGYPELYAKELSENASMLEAIHNWADSGRPVYAECGGLMYLSKDIYDFNGKFFEMAGVLPFETEMKKGRSHLGYREIELKDNCILGKKGDKLKGHEFHYSDIKPSAVSPQQSAVDKCYSLSDNKKQNLQDEGYMFKNTLASYIHIHFGSNLNIARNFIDFIYKYPSP